MRLAFNINKIIPFIFLFALLATASQAQEKKTRILFVLDASGSMDGKWEERTKYEIASDLLSKSIDSIQKTGSNIEFGLRVFGHQSPRGENNCEDSKLEVPFASKNALKIKDKLKNITVKGQTPIAYSLFQAATDFPSDPNVKNVIILITDGLETCNGDPCAVTEILQKQRISLKPFIIGLGMGDAGKSYFDCVGTYYDAEDKGSFENAINIVISQATNNTTAQVNLLDIYGKPTETNVEMVFYDAFSKEVNYIFVHALNSKGNPDTIFINPVGKYNLTVFTTPPVEKKNIELAPGKHNIIAVDAPQGTLTIKQEGIYGFTEIQAIIRKNNISDIVDIQYLNTRKKLLVGKYDIEVLTLPRTTFSDIEIEQSEEKELIVPAAGNLNIEAGRAGIASIYITKNGKPEMIYEIKELQQKAQVQLQPGSYSITYRPSKIKSAELTKTKTFTITSKGNTYIRF